MVATAQPGATIGGVEFGPTTPAAHASSHSDGGSDEITVEDLATVSTDTSQVLKPDGSGGIEFGALPTLVVAKATGFTAYGSTNTRIARMPNRNDAGDITWTDSVTEGTYATLADGGTYTVDVIINNSSSPDDYATNTSSSLSNVYDSAHIRGATTCGGVQARIQTMSWTSTAAAGDKVWISARGSQALTASTTVNTVSITRVGD
jgi:hypothetical protein